MAKNFPYFKFVATEWLTGDIVFEDYELQGIFINLCALYWHRDGILTLDEVSKRLKTDKIKLLNDRFYSLDSEGYIHIHFLDEQLIAANHVSSKNAENGRKGVEAKRNLATAKRPLSEPSAKSSKEKKNKNKRKEEVNTHTFELSPFFNPVKFAEQLPDWPKEQLRYYYDSLLDYSKQGNKYKDWIAAARTWARKDKEASRGFFSVKKPVISGFTDGGIVP